MIKKTEEIDFYSEFPIIDNEISNDISTKDGSDWRYSEGKIICCAILFDNEITYILKEKNDNEEDYKKELINIIERFPVMYAFNKNMEYGNFKGFLAKDYNIAEIKAFKGKGKTKEWFFQELIRDKIIEQDKVPFDPLCDDSKKVLDCYEKNDYDSIILHNKADVIKQYWILKYRKYFLDKYKNEINKDGWIK